MAKTDGCRAEVAARLQAWRQSQCAAKCYVRDLSRLPTRGVVVACDERVGKADVWAPEPFGTQAVVHLRSDGAVRADVARVFAALFPGARIHSLITVEVASDAIWNGIAGDEVELRVMRGGVIPPPPAGLDLSVLIVLDLRRSQLTALPKRAFRGAQNLEAILFPDELEVIECRCFKSRRLGVVDLTPCTRLARIGHLAFGYLMTPLVLLPATLLLAFARSGEAASREERTEHQALPRVMLLPDAGVTPSLSAPAAPPAEWTLDSLLQ